jgi:hypothetical protein
MLEGFRRKEKGGESKRTTITKTKESVSEDEEEENLYQDPSTVIRKPKYDEETPTQEEGTLEPEEGPREPGENPKDPGEPPEEPGGGGGGGPPPPPPPPPPQSNPLRKPDDSMKTPKPQVPTPFGGDREKWVTFVFQSLFYYNHYREFFRDPENKCIYFLSWFEGETVRPWADQILSTIGQRNQSPLMRDFDLLLSTAAGLWGPVNQRERAQNKLDNINQRTSVSAYHAEFIAHATRSEYNEETLARIFYKGLKESIKNLMVNIDRPRTTDGLLGVALQYEARILERMEERKLLDQKPKTGKEEVNKRVTAKAGRLSEEERKKRMKEGRCFLCNQIGHLSNVCPKKTAQAKRTAVEGNDEGPEEEQDFPPA